MFLAIGLIIGVLWVLGLASWLHDGWHSPPGCRCGNHNAVRVAPMVAAIGVNGDATSQPFRY